MSTNNKNSCQFLIETNVQEKNGYTHKDFDINFDISVVRANAKRSDFPFCESDPIFVYDSKWVVRVFPNGMGTETVGRINVVLKGMSENTLPIKVEYTMKAANNITLIETQTNSLSISSPIEVVDTGNGRTAFLFCGESIYLSKEKNNFRLNLSLKITHTCKSMPYDIDSRICSQLRDHLYQKTASDVDIVVEGTRIPAHKLILSLVSPVFTAMFENQMQESVSNEIVISDFSEEVVKSMLRCISDGSAIKSELTEQHADQLLFIANKYELKGLEISATNHIIDTLNVDNAIHVLLSADVFNRKNIKSAVVEFIVANADLFFDMSDFVGTVGNALMNELLGYMVANKRIK